MENKRIISYCKAINEALYQEMERDERIFVYGLDVADHKRTFGSGEGLLERFGPKRYFTTPLSEDAMMGLGGGAAVAGLRPINVHIRVDFLLLAMNQLANMIAPMHYGSGGKLSVPLVIRAIIGRGWGQGFQHSKTLQSIFAHIPGLKVIMPTTPHDAKGLLIAAIRDNNPVLVLEHRLLYWQEGPVLEEAFETPIGRANILRSGEDITIAATSWMNVEAYAAARIMEKRGVNVEIVDIRSIAPLDDDLIAESANKTGHLIVADYDWTNCGLSAEIAARIYERCMSSLRSPITRIGFAPTPCPTTRPLENLFYPSAETLVRAIEKKLDLDRADLSGEEFFSYENKFKGPF
ncbi:MAG: transketolase C-terminal domain-containing protein [bacterium]|nr:transketolase C-terminal domain-containing protein [bacterium]